MERKTGKKKVTGKFVIQFGAELLIERKRMMERVMMAVAGFFIGGFLGWFMGVAWYELIEVPKAASMGPMMAPTYLCAAGNALSLLAVPGAILGAIFGALKNQAGIRKEKSRL